MGLPSHGFESLYRNDIDDVAAFLDLFHKDHYKVVNLSQKSYNYSKFHEKVIEFGFPDHHAPELHKLFLLCK